MKNLHFTLLIAVFFVSSFSSAQEYTSLHRLLKSNVNFEGNVDYNAIKNKPETLQKALDEISAIKINANWNQNQKLAFWMNVYNAYTIKLIIDNYPVKSIKKIEGGKPWDKKFIKANGKTYSLNQIEHEILRKMNDPRIHFGINCASISCPKLSPRAFNQYNVDGELTILAKYFINDSSKNSLSEEKIQISKLFSWFTDDFGGSKKEIIAFINKYSNTKVSTNASISYKTYNWRLNKK